MNKYKILFSLLVILQFAEQDCFSMGDNSNNDEVNKKRTREEFCEQDQKLAKCFNNPKKKQKLHSNDSMSFFNSFNQSSIHANNVINNSPEYTDNTTNAKEKGMLPSLREIFPSVSNLMVNEPSFPFLNHLGTENNNVITNSPADTNKNTLPSLKEIFPSGSNFMVNESSFPLLNYLGTENTTMVNNSILNTTNELHLPPGKETSTNNFVSKNFNNTHKPVNGGSLIPGMEVLTRPNGSLYYKFQDILNNKTKDELFNILTEEVKKTLCRFNNKPRIKNEFLNSYINYFKFIINESEKRLTQENFYRLIEQKVYSIHGPGKSLFKRLNSSPLARSELFQFLYSKYTSNDAFVDHILCNKNLNLFNEGAQHGRLLLNSLHKLVQDQMQQKKISTDNKNKIVEIMQNIATFNNKNKEKQLKIVLNDLKHYSAPRDVLNSSFNITSLCSSPILQVNDNKKLSEN